MKKIRKSIILLCAGVVLLGIGFAASTRAGASSSEQASIDDLSPEQLYELAVLIAQSGMRGEDALDLYLEFGTEGDCVEEFAKWMLCKLSGKLDCGDDPCPGGGDT